MKIELIIRDSEGRETPTSSETLAPSKEYSIGENCSVRLRHEGSSQDCTLQLITQRPPPPSPGPDRAPSPLSQALAIITHVPAAVFEAFDNNTLRLLGILAHAKGMEMSSVALAVQNSGLLSTLSADDVDNALSTAGTRLSEQGFSDLLKHPNTATWRLKVMQPKVGLGATPD